MDELTIPARTGSTIPLGEDYGELHNLLIHVDDLDLRQQLHDTLTYSWHYIVNPSVIVFPDGQTLLERTLGIQMENSDE